KPTAPSPSPPSAPSHPCARREPALQVSATSRERSVPPPCGPGGYTPQHPDLRALPCIEHGPRKRGCHHQRNPWAAPNQSPARPYSPRDRVSADTAKAMRNACPRSSQRKPLHTHLAAFLGGGLSAAYGPSIRPSPGQSRHPTPLAVGAAY